MSEENPIKIQALDHVVIRARDLSAMIVFYRDVLGCSLERELEDLGLAQLRQKPGDQPNQAMRDLMPAWWPPPPRNSRNLTPGRHSHRGLLGKCNMAHQTESHPR